MEPPTLKRIQDLVAGDLVRNTNDQNDANNSKVREDLLDRDCSSPQMELFGSLGEQEEARVGINLYFRVNI